MTHMVINALKSLADFGCAHTQLSDKPLTRCHQPQAEVLTRPDEVQTVASLFAKWQKGEYC